VILDTEGAEVADEMDRGGRRTDGRDSAPSWQDYIDALKVEGLRYRPASLSKALAERERAGGNPRTSEKDGK
jgi:hypothetical protein